MSTLTSSRRDTTRRTPDEESPLLPGPGKNSDASESWIRLSKHMNANVSKHRADLVLLFCYIVTGLLDSSAVFIWGSFVSMQTGNTIYLGLGLVAPNEGIRWIKAGTSIAAFCFGAFCFSRFHRYFSPKKRWVLVTSYALQTLLIVMAALIVALGDESGDGLNWQVLLPLAAVAFQSAGQAVTSRSLEHNTVTSVVLTSNYCDGFSDPNLFVWKNPERNKRVAAPVLLLLGACFGGLYAHSSIGLAGALWTAVGLKTVAIVAWLFWPSDDVEE